MPPATPLDIANAQVRVVHPDGSAWDVPVLSILRERALQRSQDLGRLSRRRCSITPEVVHAELQAEWTRNPRLILDEVAHVTWASIAADARRIRLPRPPDPNTLELYWLEGAKRIVDAPSPPDSDPPA